MATASVERMTVLAEEISRKTKVITEYLASKGLEATSFDVQGLAQFPIDPSEGEPYNARLELIALTKELHDIAVGPKESLRYLAWDVKYPTVFSPSGSQHRIDLCRGLVRQ